MSVPNMREAFEANAVELEYNSSQTRAAENVLDILRQPQLDHWHIDDALGPIGPRMSRWCRAHALWSTTPPPALVDVFYSRMQICIQNCLENLLRWYDPHEEVQDVVFDDVFRLLLGTFDIPLSDETAALIGADDVVLTGENPTFKAALQRDPEWLGILRTLASVAERVDEPDNVCASIEAYTIPELHRRRLALLEEAKDLEVYSGVTIALHRTPEEAQATPRTTVDLMHQLLQLTQA
jgi:hypothetical protein